jgi:quinol-cytochrome oxidoreductase complex cytochrome b subunit
MMEEEYLEEEVIEENTTTVIPPVKEYSGSPFWPGEVLSEGGMILLTIATLFFLAALLPAPLGEEANPMKTLHPIYPEWYLLSVFGFVRFWVWDILIIPAKLIGLLAPMVLVILILLLPFYDTWDKGSGEGQLKHIRRRKKGAILAILTLIAAVVMGAMAVLLEKGIVTVG